jgi:hypothetical protein
VNQQVLLNLKKSQSERKNNFLSRRTYSNKIFPFFSCDSLFNLLENWFIFLWFSHNKICFCVEMSPFRILTREYNCFLFFCFFVFYFVMKMRYCFVPDRYCLRHCLAGTVLNHVVLIFLHITYRNEIILILLYSTSQWFKIKTNNFFF